MIWKRPVLAGGFVLLVLGVAASTWAQKKEGPLPEGAVVDRILDSYKRLRNGHKRLSQEDKLRLDQHINAVAELQRRLTTTVTAGCRVPTRPTTDNLKLRPMDGAPEKNLQFFTMINEVLAVAMNCGATRIATFSIDENNSVGLVQSGHGLVDPEGRQRKAANGSAIKSRDAGVFKLNRDRTVARLETHRLVFAGQQGQTNRHPLIGAANRLHRGL